jgi:hypothetical protein
MDRMVTVSYRYRFGYSYRVRFVSTKHGVINVNRKVATPQVAEFKAAAAARGWDLRTWGGGMPFYSKFFEFLTVKDANSCPDS